MYQDGKAKYQAVPTSVTPMAQSNEQQKEDLEDMYDVVSPLETANPVLMPIQSGIEPDTDDLRDVHVTDTPIQRNQNHVKNETPYI